MKCCLLMIIKLAFIMDVPKCRTGVDEHRTCKRAPAGKLVSLDMLLSGNYWLRLLKAAGQSCVPSRSICPGFRP